MNFYLAVGSSVVTFETSHKADGPVLVTTQAGEAGRQMSRTGARAYWAELVRDGATRFECRDPEGHDGEACSCNPEGGQRMSEYENGCEGHPAGEFDPMGVTVYCDGSCS